MEWIRLILGIGFLLLGLFIFVVEIIGVFKMNYVLNRMHAAAMGDTLGISASLIGLMFLSGFTFVTLKFALVIAFLWVSSPVSSHLLALLEFKTNEDQPAQYEVEQEERK